MEEHELKETLNLISKSDNAKYAHKIVVNWDKLREEAKLKYWELFKEKIRELGYTISSSSE